MNKVIIDCSIGKQKIVKMTPEEEEKRLTEIEEARLEDEAAKAQEAKRREAIERLRLSSNRDTRDLLDVLGF